MRDIPAAGSNPVTPIAIFAGMVEIVGVIVLPSFSAHLQDVFIWFLIAFPVLVVALYFATLNFNPRVLGRSGGARSNEGIDREEGAQVTPVPEPRQASLLDRHPDEPVVMAHQSVHADQPVVPRGRPDAGNR